MTVRVQQCWNGHRLLYRILLCGGLLVRAETWNRATAKLALNLLGVELPNVKRSSIRFKHV